MLVEYVLVCEEERGYASANWRGASSSFLFCGHKKNLRELSESFGFRVFLSMCERSICDSVFLSFYRKEYQESALFWELQSLYLWGRVLMVSWNLCALSKKVETLTWKIVWSKHTGATSSWRMCRDDEGLVKKMMGDMRIWFYPETRKATRVISEWWKWWEVCS